MTKKGQAAIIGFIFMLIIFFFIWTLWLGQFLQLQADQYITAGTVTGLEAFIYANLNLIIALGIILAIFFAIAFGGGAT
jgi:hypothetical protein